MERLCDFFGGCMIFCVERLRFVDRLHDFCVERLRDFFHSIPHFLFEFA